MNKLILSFLFFITTITFAEIIESDDIRTILYHVYDQDQQDVLVIFDIDNTIGHVEDGFGGDEWFTAMINERILQGDTIHTALAEILPVYFSIQKTIWLDLVQPETAKLIKFLQQVKIPVISLTSRSTDIIERTFEQLAHVDINFSLNSLYNEQLNFTLHDSQAHYLNGVLFSGNNDKGELLIHFLNQIDYHPKKVIFIDDKLKYSKQVDHALENIGIESICIRYSRLDEKVQNFNLEDYKQQLADFLNTQAI